MDVEVAALKVSVNNLSQCLHALLRRIEKLESTASSSSDHHHHHITNAVRNKKTDNEFANGLPSTEAEEDCLGNSPHSNVQIVHNETMTVDPETGTKKRTVVTERVITTKTFHAIPVGAEFEVDEEQSSRTISTIATEPMVRRTMMSWDKKRAYTNDESISKFSTTTRFIKLSQNPFRDIDYDRVANLFIVTRVKQDSIFAKDIRVGDAIIEVNGKPVTEIKNPTELHDGITLKVMVASLHQGPSVYYFVISDYDGSSDGRIPKNFYGLNLKKREIIQVFSKDATWIQGRKVNDLNQVGLCPVSAVGEQVSMLTPFGRRVLVLLGVPGVGRRTLKKMLLDHMPQHFVTVTPYTSRAQKPNELEGREYYFRTKGDMLQKIRAGEMIEWGELDNELYGTSANTVRSCIRSGRVCVLDCAPKALRYLYNAEFMPFVVLIAPPGIDELRQINKLRLQPYTDKQMESYRQENEQLMESEYAKMFHLVLVNRNMEITFKRLMKALNELKDDVQWVPEVWMRRE